MGNRNPDGQRMLRYFLMNKEGVITPTQIFQREDISFFDGTGVPGPQLISTMNFPHTRSSLFAVSDKGTVFSAWTEKFLINVHDPYGNHLRTFQVPFENSKLDRNEIIQFYENHPDSRVLNRVRNENFPKTWPALHHMIADNENRLWIATITDDFEKYKWWVTDDKGEILAAFNWAGNRLHRTTEQQEIKLIKNDLLYTHQTDQETGVQNINVYRIEMRLAE